ncbi:hypothetical protein RJ639_023825 [Escallonia herrerae]|uniref:Uncharacterized protein n=1 Tax=Escallonia herrerae TaxID=1293975 RepID=A0AA88V0K6_9ASTE|nr:hypothetical protein RJ639_023825 [Escallonia herrerae]
MGSIFGTLMFLGAIFQQYIPGSQQLRDLITGYGNRAVALVYPYIQTKFREYPGDGFNRSTAYAAIETYLGANTSTRAKRLKGDVVKDGRSLVLSMDDQEEIAEEFEGVRVWWVASKNIPHGQTISFYPRQEERKFYRLTFHRCHRQLVTGSYLSHVLDEGKAISVRNRQRKLYTNSKGDTWDGSCKRMWSPVVFEHPATFDTLAMDPIKKKEITNDLFTFSKAKAYYEKIGKAWKRGYLLYGPPGTGKSSMIAAMANFLEYDVYDLELTAVKDNTELRKLLINTSGFKLLARNYLDVGAHHLFDKIRVLLGEVEMMPADVGKNLMPKYPSVVDFHYFRCVLRRESCLREGIESETSASSKMKSFRRASDATLRQRSGTVLLLCRSEGSSRLSPPIYQVGWIGLTCELAKLRNTLFSYYKYISDPIFLPPAPIMKLPNSFAAAFLFLLWHLVSSGNEVAQACTFYVSNKCSFPIWPATAVNSGNPVIGNGGFYLPSGQVRRVQAPGNWNGRIWARTGCNFASKFNWKAACETGDCDRKLECNGSIGLPPATLVQISLQVDKSKPSFYDVSVVDGYNLPVSVMTKPNVPKCHIGGCLKDMNSICPQELEVLNAKGEVVACKSACLAFDLDKFCCRNDYAFDNPPPLVNCTSDEYFHETLVAVIAAEKRTLPLRLITSVPNPPNKPNACGRREDVQSLILRMDDSKEMTRVFSNDIAELAPPHHDKNDTELRYLLVDLSSKSRIAIEDIDCSLDLTGKRKQNKKENEQGEGRKEEEDPIQRQVKRRRKVTKKQPGKHILVENYLDLDSHSSFETIQELLEETQITPADDFEILTPKTLLRDADACLENLIRSSQDYERRRTDKRMPRGSSLERTVILLEEKD